MSREKGFLFEKIALEYMLSMGFTHIRSNYYTKHGEIDLILLKDNVLYFVEVKGGACLDPALNITPKKIARMLNSVYTYLQDNNDYRAHSCSAIILRGKDIEFIDNILI